MIRPPSRSTLFPYTTLFRSSSSSQACTSASSSRPRISSRATPTGSSSFTCPPRGWECFFTRSEEHTSELQSRLHLVCRLLLEKKNYNTMPPHAIRHNTIEHL